jgi:hypothetical protein
MEQRYGRGDNGRRGMEEGTKEAGYRKQERGNKGGKGDKVDSEVRSSRILCLLFPASFVSRILCFLFHALPSFPNTLTHAGGSGN